MSCCIEDAILDTLRALDCTPIRSENHFVGERSCTDCMPYLVMKADAQFGLRTSSGSQKVHSVDIKAYFAGDKKKQAADYRTLVEAWVFAQGCVDLGICGCFCIQGNVVSSIRPSTGSTIVYSLSFRGFYKQADSSSDSASESV